MEAFDLFAPRSSESRQARSRGSVAARLSRAAPTARGSPPAWRACAPPALFERVRGEPGLVPAFIEEARRLDSPVQLLARTCTQPIELDGVPIAAGDRVLFHLASANRDEACFEAPDAFRLERPNPRDRVAFGAGAHVCPGAYLARMETRVVLETLLARVERLALAPGFAWDPNPVFWAFGPRTLRLTLS